MPKAVIDIINGARRLSKDSELTATEYDSSAEADIAELREAFNTAYEYLIEKKADDFRYEYDVTTAASQKAYTLPISTEYISNVTSTRVIDPTKGSSYNIYYSTESRIKRIYPNPDADIEEGKPYEWWINTTDTLGSRELRFVNTPDGVYIVRFYLQSVPASLTGNDLTSCSRKGDEWLKLEMAATVLESRGFAQAAKYRDAANEYFRNYLVNDLFTEHRYSYATPVFAPWKGRSPCGGEHYYV